MTGVRINYPAPRIMQAKRIRVRYGVDPRRASLLAELAFNEVPS